MTDFENFKLAVFEHWELYLHQEQQYLGRCYAALRSRLECDPFDLPEFKQREFVEVAFQVRRACDTLFKPDLYNYANFRNEWSVCHWHIIPRYKSKREFAGYTFEDSQWGQNYAPYRHLPKPDQDVVLKVRDHLRPWFKNGEKQ